MTAPVFLSAAIFAILSILISANGRQYAPISPRLNLTTFTTYDVVVTIVRIIGAASIGVAESKQKDPATANNIFLAFLNHPRLTEFLCRARRVLRESVSWGFVAAFVAAALLIYLRVCFGLAETAEGLLSNLSTHEVYF